MTNKERLSGGLANLLTGADQSVTRQQPTEPEVTLPPIIETVEDAETRKRLEERLRKKQSIGRGRPRKNESPDGIAEGYARTSLIINSEKWAKVKEIAFRETLTLKEVMDAALDIIIERYESKHGEVKPQPRTKKDIKDIF